IAAIFTLKDLLSSQISTSSYKNWVTSYFVDYWLSRQFIGNAVNVNNGEQQSSFARLPDGSFAPRNVSSERLVQTGSRSAQPQFIGNPMPEYDYRAITFDLISGDGSNIHFDWMAEIGNTNRVALP